MLVANTVDYAVIACYILLMMGVACMSFDSTAPHPSTFAEAAAFRGW